jgi:hypothetical protein
MKITLGELKSLVKETLDERAYSEEFENQQRADRQAKVKQLTVALSRIQSNVLSIIEALKSSKSKFAHERARKLEEAVPNLLSFIRSSIDKV